MELITNFLIEEGFAPDTSSANAILSVMSEEWLRAILDEVNINSPAMIRSSRDFIQKRITPKTPEEVEKMRKIFQDMLDSGEVRKNKRPTVYLGQKK